MVHPAESTRSPDDDAARAVHLPDPDVEALVSSAGRAIDRLQAFAVAVRALASDAKARLDALPDENDDGRPETVKARASLRVLARVARGRLRDTLDALQDARARPTPRSSPTIVAARATSQPPAKPQKTSPAPPPSSPQSSRRRRRRTDSSPRSRNSPAKATSTESRARTGTGTGTGTGIGTGTKRDGDAFPHPSRVYRTGMRLAPRNLRRWKISDRARARRPSTFSAA